MNKVRRQILIATAILSSAKGSDLFAAVNYPIRPVKVIIPYPPGGPTDIVGRLVCMQMAENFKQPFSVENRPGASGMIGADIVAKSAPDGYTLLINVSGQVINPYLYASVPHDPLKDFTPITNLASTPIQLVVSANSRIKSIKELVDACRADPGKYSFASSSNGTPGHLTGELFKSIAKLNVTHIPYKGSAPALTDVIGGQVEFMFDSMPSSIGLVEAGRLRSLGVTSTRRVESLPNVPTFIESGYPELTLSTWYGMWAPAGTPNAIVQTLNSEVSKILLNPETKARLAKVQALGVGDSSANFAEFCKLEAAKYAAIIKSANISLQ